MTLKLTDADRSSDITVCDAPPPPEKGTFFSRLVRLIVLASGGKPRVRTDTIR